MSRRSASIRRAAIRCGPWSEISISSKASRYSSRPTTWTRRIASPSASPSSTTAASSRSGRPPSSNCKPAPIRSKRPSSSSPARRFATRAPPLPTKCGRSPACGGGRGRMSVIYVLWLREVKKYLRSRVQIVASLGSPLMYLGVLGFGLGPVFQRAGEGKYLQFMAPGVIGMTVLFTAMFSGIAMLWDRQFGFLKETLVAPVPRLLIMIGRTLGGATVAVLQGTLIFVVTLAFLVIALIAVIFSALATAIGSSIKEMQGFQMVMNFLVMPLFFLSGAIYPLDGLPRVLAALTRVDPLTYGVDGVRGLLTGRTHFGVPLDVAVLLSVGVLFVLFGAWRFSKLEA